MRLQRHHASATRSAGEASARPKASGICHSYAPDGRCISLLKILLTNFCQYDCLYCVNRVSSNVPRARFSVDEVVALTLDFYRRNCIEGLFLSSGIIRSPDYTMEQVVEVARVLREEHDFRGYIHLKTIPDAAPELLRARRPLRRPAEHQHRAAHRAGPRRRWRPRRTAPPSAARWRGCACTSTMRRARRATQRRAPVVSMPTRDARAAPRRRASRRPARARR